MRHWLSTPSTYCCHKRASHPSLAQNLWHVISRSCATDCRAIPVLSSIYGVVGALQSWRGGRAGKSWECLAKWRVVSNMRWCTCWLIMLKEDAYVLFYVHGPSQNFTAVLLKSISNLRVLLAWFQQNFIFSRDFWHLALNACPLKTPWKSLVFGENTGW